ncbi:MAG: hypothetical protein ABH825_02520 [Candidatus Omnitrophota bacterium]
MEKKKTEIIITAVLGAVLVLILARNIPLAFKRRPSAAMQGRASVSRQVSRTASARRVPQAEQEKPEFEDKGWSRDPFFVGQIASGGSSDESIVLNGIIWDQGNPSAIVNNTIVGEGEEIGKARIVEIKENSVIVQQDGSMHELYIWQE